MPTGMPPGFKAFAKIFQLESKFLKFTLITFLCFRHKIVVPKHKFKRLQPGGYQEDIREIHLRNTQIGDNLENEDYPKNKGDPKMKMTPKIKTTQK